MSTLDFETWMEQADKAVINTVGLSIHDLADIDYRGLYDSEASPEEAAQAALANEGWGE